MKKICWRAIPISIFVFLVFFFWRGLSLDPRNLPTALQDKPLPAFSLPSLTEENSKLTNLLLQGHVTLLNVWASWCATCIDEQLFLLKLAQEGVAIYGLNYKDSASDAKRWLAEWGNPYRLVGADINGKAAIDLGVYGAPETFLIDKTGMIRYRYAGALTEHVWQEKFLPRIRLLEQAP